MGNQGVVRKVGGGIGLQAPRDETRGSAHHHRGKIAASLPRRLHARQSALDLRLPALPLLAQLPPAFAPVPVLEFLGTVNEC